jgi:hypothetical protein
LPTSPVSSGKNPCFAPVVERLHPPTGTGSPVPAAERTRFARENPDYIEMPRQPWPGPPLVRSFRPHLGSPSAPALPPPRCPPNIPLRLNGARPGRAMSRLNASQVWARLGPGASPLAPLDAALAVPELDVPTQ